jgi:glycosyltransferase involved in cell wall biosynthesis
MMVVLDVTELISNPIRTGIQRVVRELICRWPEDAPMRVARYDHAGGLVAVPDAAIELITDRAPNVSGLPANEIVLRLARVLDRRTAKLPIGGRIFVPEVFFEGRRCAYHQAQLEADRNAVGFIVYDFIPWLHPASIRAAQSVPLMPYLRLLRSTQRLAFISKATRCDYAQRVMRGRGVDGPVLALGCDGLGLARQTFTPDRRGFLCIGSIDGRKNQDRVLRAFQMLWAQGHDIPLTIVGNAFAQIDASAFEAARAHPLFSWHRHADDETVRELLNSARGTVYASELEGYGLPPIESLHVGLPVICAASVPSLADLSSAGQVRLVQVTPEAIADAVLTLSDDATAARLWDEARRLTLVTWNTFARQAADWMQSE